MTTNLLQFHEKVTLEEKGARQQLLPLASWSRNARKRIARFIIHSFFPVPSMFLMKDKHNQSHRGRKREYYIGWPCNFVAFSLRRHSPSCFRFIIPRPVMHATGHHLANYPFKGSNHTALDPSSSDPHEFTREFFGGRNNRTRVGLIGYHGDIMDEPPLATG